MKNKYEIEIIENVEIREPDLGNGENLNLFKEIMKNLFLYGFSTVVLIGVWMTISRLLDIII